LSLNASSCRAIDSPIRRRIRGPFLTSMSRMLSATRADFNVCTLGCHCSVTSHSMRRTAAAADAARESELPWAGLPVRLQQRQPRARFCLTHRA
jgi:hypothetical protein